MPKHTPESKTPLPPDKATASKWISRGSVMRSSNFDVSRRCAITDEKFKVLAQGFGDTKQEALDRAALIVLAVNSRDALLKRVKRLEEALESIRHFAGGLAQEGDSDPMSAVAELARAALKGGGK